MDSINNILKYHNMLTLSNYDKFIIGEQYKIPKNRKIKINENFLNLSINQIWKNLSNTILSVFNDLIDKKPKNIESFINIFTKNNRLIYVGLFLILITFVLYFIDITS